jgi:hypothetical protein
VDGRANRNAANSVNWLGDGGFDTPLTRESASQKFNRDEIEEGVEVIGHGAPVSATLARRLTEFATGSSALPAGWATQTLGFTFSLPGRYIYEENAMWLVSTASWARACSG